MPEQAALILGSGFTDFVGTAEAQTIETPYGMPSSPLYRMTIGSRAVTVLCRHGVDHSIPPHAINYRANVDALRRSGAAIVIAINTVGVITRIRDSGQIALPDQLIDYTWGREQTFFDGGDTGVTHVDFTEPFSAELRERLLGAALAADVDCYDGGVYAAVQGPRLETAAEIDRLERDGADYVGMTGMPEATLAAERNLNYAILALVVNRAAGRGDAPIHDDVERSSAAAKASALRVIEALFAAENGA